MKQRKFDWLGWGAIAGMAIFGPLYFYLRMTWEGYSDPLVLLAEQGRAVNCVKPLVYFAIFLGAGYLFVRGQFKVMHRFVNTTRDVSLDALGLTADEIEQVNAEHSKQWWEDPGLYAVASEAVRETRRQFKLWRWMKNPRKRQAIADALKEAGKQ